MLAAFSRRTCHSRLLSLRSLVTETVTSTPAEEVSTSLPSAAPGEQQPAGQPRTPAWWSDPKCDATRAYHIISKRFKVHGPQKEENYRQLINKVNTPQEAALALNILDEGRRVRAMLQQHVPFTFATSQLLIKKCVETEAHDVALEALQRANEVGLQFFRADAYYTVMKAAVLAGRLDAAIGVFEAMKQNGVRPGPKVVHNLIMGSIINGRRDLAEAYAEEFRFNGIKINAASQEWLDGTRLPNSQRNSSEASPQPADGEATADQQKATVIANA